MILLSLSLNLDPPSVREILEVVSLPGPTYEAVAEGLGRFSADLSKATDDTRAAVAAAIGVRLAALGRCRLLETTDRTRLGWLGAECRRYAAREQQRSLGSLVGILIGFLDLEQERATTRAAEWRVLLASLEDEAAQIGAVGA